MFIDGVNLSSVIQNKSICAVFVKSRSSFDGLDANDARVMCKDGADPPPMYRELMPLVYYVLRTSPG